MATCECHCGDVSLDVCVFAGRDEPRNVWITETVFSFLESQRPKAWCWPPLCPPRVMWPWASHVLRDCFFRSDTHFCKKIVFNLQMLICRISSYGGYSPRVYCNIAKSVSWSLFVVWLCLCCPFIFLIFKSSNRLSFPFMASGICALIRKVPPTQCSFKHFS